MSRSRAAGAQTPDAVTAAAAAAAAGAGATAPPDVSATRPATAETGAAATQQAQAQEHQGERHMGANDLASIIANAVAQGVAAGIAAGKPAEKADDSPPPPDPREVQSEMQDQLAETRYLITIQRGEKDCVDPVPIGVNGITRTIKRGEYAVVTQSMLEVLENSQEQRLDPETRESYLVPSYPFTVVRELTREDWELTVAEVRQKYMPDRNKLN